MATATTTLNLIKAGIDTVLKIQAKSMKQSFTRIGPVINHKEGFYRSRIITGFGDASVVLAGQPVPSDAKVSLYETDYYFLKFAKGYDFDLEADEDDLYNEVGNYAPDLAKAMRRRQNKEMANLLNNGFDALFTHYDGQTLFSTAHPGVTGVTMSNRPATAVALGALALEDGMTALMSQTDPRGENMEFEGNMVLHCGNSLWPLAWRIVEAAGLAGTNDHDPNLTGKYMTVDRQDKITSATAWFLKMANADEHGLRMIQKGGYHIDSQKQLRTLQTLVVCWQRYIAVALQAQGTYASPGA